MAWLADFHERAINALHDGSPHRPPRWALCAPTHHAQRKFVLGFVPSANSPCPNFLWVDLRPHKSRRTAGV